MRDCPFCRTKRPDNEAGALAMARARVLKKDPEATHFLGTQYMHGGYGLQKDVQRAVKLWTEAAELGSTDALFNLGIAYFSGEGVGKDRAKAVEFWIKAAMQGHVESRHNLGAIEADKGDHDRAMKHLLIAVKMGRKESVDKIKSMFMEGVATKEQYAEALKGYQDAAEEMRSHDRDEAKRLGY